MDMLVRGFDKQLVVGRRMQPVSATQAVTVVVSVDAQAGGDTDLTVAVSGAATDDATSPVADVQDTLHQIDATLDDLNNSELASADEVAEALEEQLGDDVIVVTAEEAVDALDAMGVADAGNHALDEAGELAEALTGQIVEGVFYVIQVPLYVPITAWGNYSSTYVMFENGVVRKGIEGPPEESDIDHERLEAPNKWGQWSRNEYGFDIIWDDGFEEILGAQGQSIMEMQAAPENEVLSAMYQYAVSPLGYSYIRFTESGEFEMNFDAVRYARTGANGSVQHAESCPGAAFRRHRGHRASRYCVCR